MYGKASWRIFFLVLLGLVLRAGHTQDFGRLYSDSVTITLAEPLRWVAVPKGTVASPEAFTAAGPLTVTQARGNGVSLVGGGLADFALGEAPQQLYDFIPGSYGS